MYIDILTYMQAKPGNDHHQEFMRTIAGLWPLAKGSLSQVRRPCMRKQCRACAEGRKHPACIFTYREEGRLRCLYVRPELVPALRQAIANGRKMEKRLTQLGREMVVRHRQELAGKS